MGMAKFNGNCSTRCKMIKFFKQMFFNETKFDNLIEGVAAHAYTNEEIKKEIKEQYIKKYTLKITPLTDPLQFDPLNPPNGWYYDPYYECWVRI